MVDTGNRRSIENGRVVGDSKIVEVMRQLGDDRNRAMLFAQLHRWHLVVDQPLEEGNIELEMLGESVDVRRWAQLDVIANENQVLDTLTDGCDDMRFEDL